jgi:hypothetical protein
VRKRVTQPRLCVSAPWENAFNSSPLESLTTSHVERVFLTVRQELKRFQRKGLGYSKDLETHKAGRRAIPWRLQFRSESTRRSEPRQRSQRALRFEAWDLERVVEMTEAFHAP